jgi:hypothetical protein
MHSGENLNSIISSRHDYAWGTGLALVVVGIILLADQFLKTGWMSLLILPGCGIAFLTWGIFSRKFGLTIPGSLLTSLGVGEFFALSDFFNFNSQLRVGLLLAIFAAGWFLIFIFSLSMAGKIAWWSLIPGSILLPLGICFLIPWEPLNFVLIPTVGLSLAFLIWGIRARLIGLVIPGSILLGIGPGIYLAWKAPISGNGLTQTGVMLVCFSLGWGLITLFAKLMTYKSIWWPLIPGGILIMTGWGLYIGGSPQHALSLIGNTTSVGLILFGLYLMLWRTGLHK